MRPQAYQTPEIRDENDSIIQQGTFGKKTPFVNSQNDGILDYIINNLEVIKGMSLAATIVVSSLPSAGQAGKFYLLDDGTENSGKVYIYKDKWIEVTTQAVGLSAYQIALNNGYEGTEQEWLENEVYGDDIVSAEIDSDGYFIVHTRQGKTIKTALKPLVDAKASADKAKTSEANAKASADRANSSLETLLGSQVNADWAITDNTNKAFIKNKPDLTVYATKKELETECVDKINQLNTALKNGFTTASLTVSGETSVPTPSTENNSKTIANTEFVHGVVSNLVNGAPTALDTLQELATALGNDPNFSTTILNKIGEKESKTDAQIEYKKLQNAIDKVTPATEEEIDALFE